MARLPPVPSAASRPRHHARQCHCEHLNPKPGFRASRAGLRLACAAQSSQVAAAFYPMLQAAARCVANEHWSPEVLRVFVMALKPGGPATVANEALGELVRSSPLGR